MRNFGYGPGGGPDDFFRIIETSTDETEVSEACYAFGRLPRLNHGIVARLIPYLTSEKESIRAAIYWLAWKHTLEISYRNIEKGLTDPAAEIRKNAILVAMKKNSRHFRPLLFEMALHDPDTEVAKSAYLKMKYPEKYSNATIPFTRQECLALLQSTHADIRRLTINSGAFTPEDTDLFITILEHGSTMSKADAITQLHKMKITKAIPAILKVLEKERHKKPEEKEDHDCYVIDRAIKMLGEMGDGQCVPELLQWTTHPDDDFYRINAVTSIAQLGDERIIPVATHMLTEEKPPVRHTLDGFTRKSSIHSIKTLIKEALEKSPNPTIRKVTTHKA
ncbi:MAG: HEAT repeat domain-containing protein [Tannerellaceae bacterium]|nr:HEAT repeat domain-containing protein [Tannerellaceae bacterium]